MKKIKENLMMLLFIICIFSMIGAVGAIEADQWLTGGLMALTGILTGIITIGLQNNLNK